VEALGRVQVLCADKTGTLTKGRIQLSLVSDGELEQSLDALDPIHRRVLAVALRASPAFDEGSPIPHLTDRALVEGAHRAGVTEREGLDKLTREHDLPFEPNRGFHASLTRDEMGRRLSVKGAPELVVRQCVRWRRNGSVVPLDEGGIAELLARADAIAERGYRVLAVAERRAHQATSITEDRVRDLTFRGFVAFRDEVRATARAALADLARAGVRTIMLTGDHPSTARSIAAQLGIEGEILTGPELDKLSDQELAARLDGLGGLARVTPMQKVRIVRALQSLGLAVAMTGDGANDAPAIRLADVGIALGKRSTAAARHAADMVVTRERIETIVAATLEGRALWASVRDAVSLLVGGNLGEVLFTFGAGMIHGSSPLNARQLLLVNLVTDTLPALAVAVRPPKKQVEELSREGPEASLGKALVRDITWRAGLTATASLAAWQMARLTGSRARAATVGLVTLTATQLTQTLVSGGLNLPVLGACAGSFGALLAAVQIPGVSRFFGCRPLGPIGFAQAGAVTAIATAVAAIATRLSHA
jgi:cation-transporting ATPase I